MNPLNYIQRAILINEFTARKHVVCIIKSQAMQQLLNIVLCDHSACRAEHLPRIMLMPCHVMSCHVMSCDIMLIMLTMDCQQQLTKSLDESYLLCAALLWGCAFQGFLASCAVLP